MKVLIVEECLRTHHGHYFQYLLDLVSDGRELGHEIDILAHRDAEGDIITETGAERWLSKGVLWQPTAPTFVRRTRQILDHNWTFYREILDWCRTKGKHYDVTIFPSVRIDHFWAIGMIAGMEKTTQLGKLLAIIIDAPGSRTDDGSYCFPRSAIPWRLSLHWISRFRSVKKRLRFAAESQQMAAQLHAFCGTEFITVPHVTTLPSTVKCREVQRAGVCHQLRFGTFGFTRYDKGLDVLQDAIRILPEDSLRSFEFILQWTGDYCLPDGQAVERDPELVRSESVRYIGPFGASAEYHQWLCEIDAIVLPYRKDFYRDRMSRVAVDAALAGIPVVYPRDTWLQDFHQVYGGGVSFFAEDPASLAQAMCELAADYTRYSEVALRNRERTREDFAGKAFFSVVERMA